MVLILWLTNCKINIHSFTVTLSRSTAMKFELVPGYYLRNDGPPVFTFGRCFVLVVLAGLQT